MGAAVVKEFAFKGSRDHRGGRSERERYVFGDGRRGLGADVNFWSAVGA